MSNLVTDASGKPKPQYENEAGTAFEALKGRNGHMKVMSDDGMNPAIGATTDTMATDPEVANSVIALLKGILSKTGTSGGTGAAVFEGTQGNLWNNKAVTANEYSATVDTQGASKLSIFGQATGATDLTVYISQDSSSFYAAEKLSVQPGDFHLFLNTAARYVRLRTSAGSIIVGATLAGKA